MSAQLKNFPLYKNINFILKRNEFYDRYGQYKLASIVYFLQYSALLTSIGLLTDKADKADQPDDVEVEDDAKQLDSAADG